VNVVCSYWKAENGNNTSVWFSMFKIGATYDVHDKCSEHPRISKTDENADWVKDLTLKTGDYHSEVAKCWEFHLGQFKALWKTNEKQNSEDRFQHQNITLALTGLSVHEFLWGKEQNDCPSKCFLLITFCAVVNSVFPRTQDGIKRKEI